MKILILAVLICTVNQAYAGEITYLGVSENGQELSQSLNEKEFEQHLDLTLSALESIAEQQVSTQAEATSNKFRLSQIVLGLGASGEIGIGPFKLGAGIRHRTYYKRSL